jgi:hypothetical protein
MLKPAALAVALLWPLSGHAAELPCPPKHYFCWQAKIIFNKYGVSRVVAKAKACDWTREEIATALKCRGT